MKYKVIFYTTSEKCARRFVDQFQTEDRILGFKSNKDRTLFTVVEYFKD